MISVPLNDPGPTKSIRVIHLYFGESVSTRLGNLLVNEKPFRLRVRGSTADLHNTILSLAEDSTARVPYVRPVAIFKLDNVVDDC